MELSELNDEITPSAYFCKESLMNSLLLQCKGFNRLQKYIDVIENGVKCIEMAQDLDDVQVEIETALELWRAYRLLHKNDIAGTFYREKCLEFVINCINDNPQLVQYGCQVSEDDDASLVEMKVHFAIMQNAVRNERYLEQSLWHGKKCISIAQAFGEKLNELIACLLLAEAYFLLEKYDRAILLCEKYLESSHVCDAQLKMKAYFILQKAYFSKEEYVLSISYGSICKGIVEETYCIDPNIETEVYLGLDEAYSALHLCNEHIPNNMKCVEEEGSDEDEFVETSLIMHEIGSASSRSLLVVLMS